MEPDDKAKELLQLTAEIVVSYAENNSLPAAELPALIASVHAALSGIDQPLVEAAPAGPHAMTTARKSLANPSHIISMIDGKPYTMLRRHIALHGYSPQSYRQAFGLPADYPMTAATYSEKRSALAKKIGLGRKAAAIATPTKTRKPAKPRVSKAVE